MDIFVHDNVSRDRKNQEHCEKIAEYIITVADNIADGSMNSEQEKDACLLYTSHECNYRIKFCFHTEVELYHGNGS